jgi:protocatechuate 3,4-dioxygenase beta subunit
MRRLWWLELGIVVLALMVISRLGGPRTPEPSTSAGTPLILYFTVYDHQDEPVPEARILLDNPAASTRSLEGARTGPDGRVTLYTVLPGNEARRLGYTVLPPGADAFSGILELPQRPGTRQNQPPHVLTVEEDLNGVTWRADVVVRCP